MKYGIYLQFNDKKKMYEVENFLKRFFMIEESGDNHDSWRTFNLHDFKLNLLWMNECSKSTKDIALELYVETLEQLEHMAKTHSWL